MKIVQICDCIDYGDGTQKDIFAKKEMFESLGYSCELYAPFIDPRLNDEVDHINNMQLAPDDILLYHYGGYSCITKVFLNARCWKKILVYHNITPPELAEGAVRHICEMGYKQVRTLKGKCDYYIGDSRYNVHDLARLGVTNKAQVMPILVEFPNQQAKPLPHDCTNFLYVGRVVINKKVEDVILLFNEYFTKINANAKLDIVGNVNIMPGYVDKLTELAESLPSRAQIVFHGKVDDYELNEFYKNADLYVSMSEHEGFCIPILEAMHRGVPVLAYNAAAISETMGNAGILIDEKDHASTAKMLECIFASPDIKQQIIDAQYKNLCRFSKETLTKRLRKLLDEWQTGAALQVTNTADDFSVRNIMEQIRASR